MQWVGYGELFLNIDDCVQCFNDTENYDNILDEIGGSLQNEESDDNDVQLVKITTRKVQMCNDQLRLYLKQNVNKSAPTISLDVCALCQ